MDDMARAADSLELLEMVNRFNRGIARVALAAWACGFIAGAACAALAIVIHPALREIVEAP